MAKKVVLPIADWLQVYDFCYAIGEALTDYENEPEPTEEDYLNILRMCDAHVNYLHKAWRSSKFNAIDLNVHCLRCPSDFHERDSHRAFTSMAISRDDCVAYLTELNLEIASSEKSTSSALAKPVQRQQAHKQNILNKLKELGFKPPVLPRKQKAGARSEAKKQTQTALQNMPKATFNKAWQALRNDGEIKDAP